MIKVCILSILLVPILTRCQYKIYGDYKKESGELCVYGTAIDAKAGAVVSTTRMGIFYIDGKKNWEENILGKKIIVLGNLITVDNGLEKSNSQKISGLQKIIIRPKWKLADDDSWKI